MFGGLHDNVSRPHHPRSSSSIGDCCIAVALRLLHAAAPRHHGICGVLRLHRSTARSRGGSSASFAWDCCSTRLSPCISAGRRGSSLIYSALVYLPLTGNFRQRNSASKGARPRFDVYLSRCGALPGGPTQPRLQISTTPPRSTARASKLALQSPQPATGGTKGAKRCLPGSIRISCSATQENYSTATACHGSDSRPLRSQRPNSCTRLRQYTTNRDWNVPPFACKKRKSAFEDRAALRSKSRLS